MDLLGPIPEPQLVPQNDNYVTSVTTSMVHSGGTVETSFAPNEETRAHRETVYRNLVYQVAQYVGQVAQNQQGYNAWQNGGIQVAQNAGQNAGVQSGGLGVLEIGIKPGIQLQAEEFDFIAIVGALDEIEEVNANCILMANLQHASTSGTQLDKAPVYDTDGLAENDIKQMDADDQAI
nr:hypothetical protein [Tanacetum cinerariifolium]